jgi:hypothetical protein
LGDDARGLGAPLDAEGRKRLSNALIDGVRRNAELRGDLLGAQMLIDETKAIELAGGQSSDPLCHRVGGRMA